MGELRCPVQDDTSIDDEDEEGESEQHESCVEVIMTEFGERLIQLDQKFLVETYGGSDEEMRNFLLLFSPVLAEHKNTNPKWNNVQYLKKYD